ncbi:MAG: tetratricopeptide repeat protein [bacterium]
MQRKKQLGVFAAILGILVIVAYFNFLSCATTAPQRELTPEQKKAIEDSIRQVYERQIGLTFSLGFEPYKQGDYQTAKRYFRKVAEMDTLGIYSNMLYQRLGDSFLRLNQPDSAEWAYQIGVERLPDDPYFYKSLGYIYRQSGRTDDAINMYKTLTKLEPDTVSHWRSLGELYIAARANDDALQTYQAIIRLAPNDKKSQEILDNLLAQTGDIDAVIAQRESMTNRFPEDMKLRMDLAQSYHRAGMFEKAIVQLNVVKQKEPQNVLALELLGDSYQQIERYSDAVGIYTDIIKIKPDDKKNICNLAMANNSLGRYSTAVTQIQRALRIDPNYGLAFLTRGMVYEASAEQCVEAAGGKITFNDKLVYQLAYDEYQKAKRDLEWKSEAERRIRYVETLIPTTEDRFMNKNVTSPQGACYEWIR